jgi:uncharacterized protein
MFLEVATTLGALIGAYLTARISTHSIATLFGLVLLYSAYSSLRDKDQDITPTTIDSLTTKLKLNGAYLGGTGEQRYSAQRVPLGFGIMFGAGILSGLLGIGSGAVKVLAMDRAMKLPFKVSTTTSNFMIGVTAAASAGIYLSRGYIDPRIVMPVMLGVLGGSFFGSRILIRTRVAPLKLIFFCVIIVLGAEMIYSGLSGKIR